MERELGQDRHWVLALSFAPFSHHVSPTRQVKSFKESLSDMKARYTEQGPASPGIDLDAGVSLMQKFKAEVRAVCVLRAVCCVCGGTTHSMHLNTVSP